MDLVLSRAEEGLFGALFLETLLDLIENPLQKRLFVKWRKKALMMIVPVYQLVFWLLQVLHYFFLLDPSLPILFHCLVFVFG